MLHIFLLISQKLPIDRHETWANFNGYKLDIGPLVAKMNTSTTHFFTANPPDSDWTYYVIPGDDLDAYVQYIEGWNESFFDDYTNETLDYVSVIRCNFKEDKKVCQTCITLNDWDWALIDSGNPYKGFVYMADGQPIKMDPTHVGSKDITVDVDFIFYYDATASSDIPLFNKTYDTSESPNVRIIFSAYTSLIPKPVQTHRPTPTPSPFTPVCRYFYRDNYNPTQGFDFHLDTINTGPYGNRLKGKVNNQNYTIFYQPCERSTCPPRYNCSTTFASIWLCSDEDSKYRKICVDGGSIVSDSLNIKLDKSTDPPFAVQTFTDHVTSATDDATTEVTLICDKDIPKGHIELESFNYDSSEKKVTLLTHTEEICEEYLPQSDPPSEEDEACKIHMFSQDKKYLIAMNLVTYNKEGDPYWHMSDPTIIGTTSYSQAELFYQPCGAIQCPYGTFCEGRDDATVWLCFNPGQGLSTRTCRSFGDFDTSYNIELNVEDYLNPTFSTGLEADYFTQGRSAKVYINCDYTLKTGEFKLQNTITFTDQEHIYFNVSASQACSVGPPIWHPTAPTLGTTPTPTPQPSPNSIDFVCNETHYIYTDLDQLYQPVYNGTLKLSYSGATPQTLSRWEVWYHPWDHVPCPTGANCFGFSSANIWGCWTEDNGEYVCFPVGDVDYGNEVRPRGNSLDLGVEMLYTGAWGVETEMNVICDQNAEKNTIVLDDDAVSSWTHVNGIKVLFELDSQYVCPLAFKGPDMMPISPSPTPIPEKYKGEYYFESTIVNNTYASIDLKKLKEVELTQVYVGYRNNLYKMKLVYSPVEKVNCPSGYDCLGGAKSNIWFCGEYTDTVKVSNACKPAGDIDAGLVVDNFNDSHPMSGILFNYDGGYGNMTETHIIFQCNSSIPEHEISVEPVVFRPPPRGKLSVYFVRAHVSDVCPKEFGRQKPTGGAIFLCILMILVIGYFSVLTIVFFIKDSNAVIPNTEFWIEVLNSITAVFEFIFCRKLMMDTKSTYDNI